MMGKNEFKELIDRYISGQLSLEEEAILGKLLEEEPAWQQLRDIMDEQLNRRQPSEYQYPETVDRIRQAVLTAIDHAGVSGTFQAADSPAAGATTAHPFHGTAAVNRVHFMRRWGWAAAAALVLVATGAWFWLASRASLKIAKEQGSSLQHNDLAPGKTGAILKLADGSAISLDSLNNGVVANEQGTRIVLENGRLAYDADSAERVGYNNIITPNGRQFRLVLPDGTKVWLNAASSLRYPTVFKGSERLVELSGEAYFEISRDAKMPFRVKINEATRIQVLGTSFNVNAYSDEPAIKATLVDGSVKVVTDGSGLSDVVLKPGQQVEIRDGKMQTRQANIDQVLAWKNNEFHFSDDDLGSVMRQIARWYDVKIVYEGADRSLRFGGVISKGENVSVVLNKLEQIGIVKFRIENKTIYVK